MNVLLIYPEFPDTFWSFRHALRLLGKRSAQPPLGLLTVAAMLPKEWNLRLVDQNVRRLENEDLTWADYAFISAMVVQRDAARSVIAECSAAGVPTVAGGPLFTMEPDGFPTVDHLILNEAELTLPPFLADLARAKQSESTRHPNSRSWRPLQRRCGRCCAWMTTPRCRSSFRAAVRSSAIFAM